MTSAVREVLSDLAPRLEAARGAVEDARTALGLAIERRNELIVAGVDEGMTQSRVAALAGVKPPHVIRIVAEASRVDP